MKRAIVILLIPVFLFATSYGVAMTSLFCKGELKEKGFNIKSCCKDVNKGGCCKTQSELVKIKDDFIKTGFDFHLNNYVIIKENTFSFTFLTLEIDVFLMKGNYDNAPPLSQEPLYIQHSSLII